MQQYSALLLTNWALGISTPDSLVSPGAQGDSEATQCAYRWEAEPQNVSKTFRY